MSRLFLGAKIRQLRKGKGLAQAYLAKELGISASYLNLIEHNRRPMTPAIAGHLSELYGLDIEMLSGRREARLRDHLLEVLGDEVFGDLRLRHVALEELVAEEPQFCRAVIALYQAYRKARGELRVVSELLSDSPELANSSHRLLTILTSLRSFAEILRDNADLSEDKRLEFAGILVEESENLTSQIRQLFSFLSEGRLGPSVAAELPREEVSEALQARNNYFDEIEEWAEAFWSDYLQDWDPGEALAFNPLLKVAREKFAMQVVVREPDVADEAGHTPDYGDGEVKADHQEQGILTIPSILPRHSRIFLLLQEFAEQKWRERIDALVDDAEISIESARLHYRTALKSYFAGAVLMPYERFYDSADRLRHDLEALQVAFGAGFEQVCHRLTTLQRPFAEGVPFHFLRSDIAGNIDKRFSASGIALPRYGGVCPLWNLHSAFVQQGQILMQLVELPDGGRFVMLAKTVAKPKAHHWAPDRLMSVSIGCDASFARRLVYADGLDYERMPPVPVGITCRQCVRADCRHRAYPLMAWGEAEESGPALNFVSA
jgi:hypothetical protein